ncbi:MAG: O-antigen ligase family protein [Gammaproteobacteria bacterium]
MLAKLGAWTYKPLLAYPDKTEQLVYVLVFLFPIAGMSVKHWISTLFNALVLLSLFSLHKSRTPLLKEEKVFLWICAAYFAMFVIAALGNGWGELQTRYLGTETRFLWFIPLYLLIRRYPDCTAWLLKGSVLGGFVLLAQAYHDVFIAGGSTATGLYSKNIIGPFAVLTAFWCLHYLWQQRRVLHWAVVVLILMSVVAALLTAGLSGSRGAYVGFVVTGIFCIMFFSRPRWMFASLAVMGLTGFLFYQNMPIVQNGVDKAVTEVQEYFAAADPVSAPSSATSTGVRLEMLRTGLLFVKDHPLIGIGPGNYRQQAKVYVAEGKASPAIADFHHPHNTFIEVASAKGLLGLLTVLLLFYYPVYVYIRGYRRCRATAVIGLIHVVALSTFSLTDHSVVLMNNYTSILLLGTAIFFSAHMRACRLRTEHG